MSPGWTGERMVEAGGVGILSLLDNMTLIDFIRRQKHQNHQIRRSEVHGEYKDFSAICGLGIHMRKRCTTASFPALHRILSASELWGVQVVWLPGNSISKSFRSASLGPSHARLGCSKQLSAPVGAFASCSAGTYRNAWYSVTSYSALSGT